MFGKIGFKISSLFSGKKLDNDTLESLEELLITSDISYDIVLKLIDEIKKQRFDKETNFSDIKEILRTELVKILKPCEVELDISSYNPFSVVMIGVNGSG